MLKNHTQITIGITCCGFTFVLIRNFCTKVTAYFIISEWKSTLKIADT
jgi:hypothetical protein